MKSQPLNKASPKMDAFSPSRFIKDFEKTCEAIGAPFSKHETRAVLSAFSPEFHKGAILWRTTNKPGSGLKYRFNKRRSTDIIGIAKEAGLLEPDNRLAKLLKFWSEPWRGECELALPDLGCDFDTKHGLTKAWAYMGGLRPFGEIIDVDDAPVGVMRHEQIFKDLNLNFVRHIAVDFHSNTVDLYFRASDPLSKQRALNFVDLVGHSRISESDYAEMEQRFSPDGFTFAVTISVSSGLIDRVAFYVMGLPKDAYPDIGHRTTKNSIESPNHDADNFTAVAWSYRRGKNMEVERSYWGQVVPLLRA